MPSFKGVYVHCNRAKITAEVIPTYSIWTGLCQIPVQPRMLRHILLISLPSPIALNGSVAPGHVQWRLVKFSGDGSHSEAPGHVNIGPKSKE